MGGGYEGCNLIIKTFSKLCNTGSTAALRQGQGWQGCGSRKENITTMSKVKILSEVLIICTNIPERGMF